ncbi:tail fiber domain-containing protein [Mesorhizobium sp. CCNWLW179-1]
MKTAQAQTGTNISTATANSILGNVNQITPYGNLTFNQTGQQFVADANGQSYWKSPDGKYQTNAPGMVNTNAPGTTKKEPIYGPTSRDGKRQVIGYKDVTTGGGSSSSVPTGWTQVNGQLVPQYTATQTLSPEQQKIFEQTQGAQLNLGTLANQQSKFLTDYLGKPFSLNGLPAGGNANSLTMPNYQQFGKGPGLQTDIANAGKIQSSFGGSGAITNTYSTDFSKDRDKYENALMTRLNTQISRDREANESSLANQGIRLGSSAYGASQDDFSRGVTDARLGAILSAGQEQSRMVGLEADRAAFQNAAQQQGYNQAMGRAGFSNQAQQQQFGQNATSAGFRNDALQQGYQNDLTRTQGNNALQDQSLNAQLARFNAQNTQRSQAMNEAFAARNQPLNEISSLLSGSQLTAPNFINANMPTIPTTDVAGLINKNYDQRLGAWQQNNANSQGLLGGLFGLGSAFLGNPALMPSDKRLKKDTTKVMDLDDDGTGLWTYRYKGEDKSAPKRIGLMAQEVEKKNPGAVVTMPGGYKAVDYKKALTGLMAMGAR